jgi:hypothetical protein
MRNSAVATKVSSTDVQCPYCRQVTSIELPENYAPVYEYCTSCRAKFIVERLAIGFQVLTLEEAPCYSDPDCREIEMGASDEQ